MSTKSNNITLFAAHEMKKFQNLAAVVVHSICPKDMTKKYLQKAIFETCHCDKKAKKLHHN